MLRIIAILIIGTTLASATGFGCGFAAERTRNLSNPIAVADVTNPDLPAPVGLDWERCGKLNMRVRWQDNPRTRDGLSLSGYNYDFNAHDARYDRNGQIGSTYFALTALLTNRFEDGPYAFKVRAQYRQRSSEGTTYIFSPWSEVGCVVASR